MTDNTSTSILIVKMSSLGDLFHALPAAALLKEHLHAKIDWVTQPEYKDLVECFTVVDHVYTYPRRQFFRQCIPFVKELRQSSYDIVIDLQGLLKSALVTAATRSSRKIGPSYYREAARLFYNETAGTRDKNRHAVEENLDVIRHLNLPTDPITFPVQFPRIPLDTSHPRIALLPCSRWPTKNWPIEHFITLAKNIRKQQPETTFYIAGGPDDRPTCSQLEQQVEGTINTCGKTSLVQLGSLLQEMDQVITVDSGPMHMAAATGVPVLALFGPTDPKRTGPYGRQHTIIQTKRPPCWPCRNRTCPDCLQAMQELTPDLVLKKK